MNVELRRLGSEVIHILSQQNVSIDENNGENDINNLSTDKEILDKIRSVVTNAKVVMADAFEKQEYYNNKKPSGGDGENQNENENNENNSTTSTTSDANSAEGAGGKDESSSSTVV